MVGIRNSNLEGFYSGDKQRSVSQSKSLPGIKTYAEVAATVKQRLKSCSKYDSLAEAEHDMKSPDTEVSFRATQGNTKADSFYSGEMQRSSHENETLLKVVNHLLKENCELKAENTVLKNNFQIQGVM